MKNKRGRAWRRRKDRQHSGNGMGCLDVEWKGTKKWGHMYMRFFKISRARQLGFEYPRKYPRQIIFEAEQDMDDES